MLKVSDLGITSLYKQGDIFNETILFYTYFTLLKITTTTGKSSFLLIPGLTLRLGGWPGQRQGCTVCRPVGGADAAHSPRGKPSAGCAGRNTRAGADWPGSNSGPPTD